MNQVHLYKKYGIPLLESTPTGWCVPCPKWYNKYLVSVFAPTRGNDLQTFLVHEDLLLPWEGVLDSVDTEWITQITGWVPRHKMTNPARGLSMHAWGLAIDVNWDENPYGSRSHKLTNDFIAAMEDNGFTWGGDWAVPDPMHFELEVNP